MSTHCASCDRKVRKGMGRRALVCAYGEAPHMGIVCTSCYASGTMHVTPPPTTIPPPCEGCKHEPAAYGAACYGAACENVRTLSGANAALAATRAA